MDDPANCQNKPLTGVGLKRPRAGTGGHGGFQTPFTYLNTKCFKKNPGLPRAPSP